MTVAENINPFVISRVFNAPRRAVWQAWTERQHMSWWGPKGVTLGHAQIDFRLGGTFHYSMKTPDGREMWGRWVIREIAAPVRLVFVNSFSDASGGITRHPLSPSWPLEMLTTTTFEEENLGTKLTIRWEPINATDIEIKTFNEGHASMTGGWGGSLDRLAEQLEQSRKN